MIDTEQNEDRVWEVHVTGEAHALALLSESLASGELSVRQDGADYFLRAAEFRDVDEATVVRSRAKTLVASLSGAATLLLGWPAELSVGNMSRRRPDGKRDQFIEVEPVRVTARVLPPTLMLRRADGTEEVRRPGDPAVQWLRCAANRPSIHRVLRLVADPDLGWVELYRIFEAVLDDAGEAVFQWASKADVGRFKHTANSVGALNDAARHGRETTQPPVAPMTLREARTLVLGLVRTWLTEVAK